MELIDALNGNKALCAPLIKYLQKRIEHKNPESSILALNLLEMLVKNVQAIHPLVADREYLTDLAEWAAPEFKKVIQLLDAPWRRGPMMYFCVVHRIPGFLQWLHFAPAKEQR